MASTIPVRAVSVLVAALTVASATSAAGQRVAALEPTRLTPVHILLTVKKTYARCRSYRDTGEVMTSGLIEGGQFGSRVPFATAFSRPGRFRFEFTDEGLGERSSNYIAWSDGAEVRSWWDAQPGVRKPGSVQEALGAVSGISGGASLRVPGLLLPESVTGGLFLSAPERLDDEAEEGSPCYRLRGGGRETPYTLTSGSTTVTVEDELVTVWIDRATFLLRKVEERRTLSTYRTVTTCTYSPELDVEIPDAQLAFAPPLAE